MPEEEAPAEGPRRRSQLDPKRINLLLQIRDLGYKLKQIELMCVYLGLSLFYHLAMMLDLPLDFLVL